VHTGDMAPSCPPTQPRLSTDRWRPDGWSGIHFLFRRYRHIVATHSSYDNCNVKIYQNYSARINL